MYPIVLHFCRYRFYGASPERGRATRTYVLGYWERDGYIALALYATACQSASPSQYGPGGSVPENLAFDNNVCCYVVSAV